MAVDCKMRPSTSADRKVARRVKLVQGPETVSSKLSKKKDKTKRRQKEDATHQLTSLLRIESDQLNEQLLIASEKGKQRAVFLLLHQGVDKDRCRGFVQVDSFDSDVVALFKQHGYSPVHHAAARGHLDVLQLLLDFGWSVDVRNDALETPLHLACFDGHVHVAEFLLDRGADINARTRDEDTPLFYAARKGQYRTVRLLVRRECDLGAKNCYGDVAEEEARDAKTLAEFAPGNEDLERVNCRNSAWSTERCWRIQRVLFVSRSEKLRVRVASVVSVASSCRQFVAMEKSWCVAMGLLLNATMGMGTVPQMALLGTGTSNLFRLNLSRTVSRRPYSCDKAILARVVPLSAKERERPRFRERYDLELLIVQERNIY
ncbi:Ankyrin repeat-containing domain [Phytophthora cactorum]|nr:Ankyrin repeat-containing domain [Phytophthora cactorum]